MNPEAIVVSKHGNRDGGDYSWGPVALPDFCVKCGAVTILEHRVKKKFNPRNGRPRVEGRLVCPNRRRVLDGHTKSWWSLMHYLPPRPKAVEA